MNFLLIYSAILFFIATLSNFYIMVTEDDKRKRAIALLAIILQTPVLVYFVIQLQIS